MKLKRDILIPANLEIDPHVYVDIILKFEPYLKIINYFGGYLFQEHLYKFSHKSRIQTFRDIHKMEDECLIKIINLNKNNYIILTKIALRYLKGTPNVSQPRFPTSMQLKTCVYLAQYIKDPKDFFQLKKPYTWFLEKYRNEIEKYKSNDPSTDINFLNNYKNKVEIIKNEELKSKEKKDIFAGLLSSKIYFDCINNNIVTLLILDFDRTKPWIVKTIYKKIEPIFRYLQIYKGYNLKILVPSKGRKDRLKKDIKNINYDSFIFLKDIEIINLNTLKFFYSSIKIKDFMKESDKLDIEKLKSKLK